MIPADWDASTAVVAFYLLGAIASAVMGLRTYITRADRLSEGEVLLLLLATIGAGMLPWVAAVYAVILRRRHPARRRGGEIYSGRRVVLPKGTCVHPSHAFQRRL